MSNYPETMKIDDVEYVRKDADKGCEVDGLKYAIVRSRNQGVMAGFVKSINGQTVELLRARQLWRWDSNFVLVELASQGVRKMGNCRFSIENTQPVVMLEACGVLYCTAGAADSIMSVEAYVA